MSGFCIVSNRMVQFPVHKDLQIHLPTNAGSILKNVFGNYDSKMNRLWCQRNPSKRAISPKSFRNATVRILVSGEASGFLNLFGDGISSALASGRIAGRVSFESIQKGISPGRLYRQEIEAEKRKTLSTFNYKTLLFREGNAFNFKKGLQALDWKKRLLFSRNLLKWLLTVKG